MQAIQTSGYTVYFNQDGYDYLNEILLPEKYSCLFIIADTNTAGHCLPAFLSALSTEVPVEIIETEAGEENKTIETCIQIWHALAEMGADRKSLIINLGGGMVTDLGGFIAATFKRGISFINIPTSLLAMTDAAIGGKTGIDLGSLKNQVGAMHNPQAVIIDTAFLDTLPVPEMRSGFAEMLKHGLISDKRYWNSFLDLQGITTDDLPGLIYKSVIIKTGIVQQDPFEKGLRKVLNFGHTLGHAIESYFLDNNNRHVLLHGEAVAAGMVLESYLSVEQELLTPEDYREIKTVINSVFNKISFAPDEIDNIIKLLAHDKKNEFGAVQFVLLQEIGKPVINQQVEKALIYKAFNDYQN